MFKQKTIQQREKGRRGEVAFSAVLSSTAFLFRSSIILAKFSINAFPINVASNRGRKSNLIFFGLPGKGSFLVRVILVTVLRAGTFIIKSSRFRPNKENKNTSIKEHDKNNRIMCATYPSLRNQLYTVG